MKRMVIAVVGLLVVVAAGFVVWSWMPAQVARREERQACEAVYDQVRRQIDSPAFAEFDSCDDATIVPGEPGSYFVTAYYELGGAQYLFVGQAWQTGGTWEATAKPPLRTSN